MPENQPATWIEPPPPKRSGMGCFLKGCLTVVVAAVILFCVLLVAGFFTVHYVEKKYLASAPAEIPVAPATPEEVQTLRQQWKAYKQTVEQNRSLPPTERQLAHLEYSATQINQLIASGKGRGHVSVAINNGVMQVSFSIGTDALRRGNVDVPGFAGRYANGTFSVTTPDPTAPSQVVIQDARLNGQPISASWFDTSYRGENLRSYVARYASDNSINTVQIVGDKVVLDAPATP